MIMADGAQNNRTISRTTCLDGKPHDKMEMKFYRKGVHGCTILKWCKKCGMLNRFKIYELGHSDNFFVPDCLDFIEDNKENPPETDSGEQKKGWLQKLKDVWNSPVWDSEPPP